MLAVPQPIAVDPEPGDAQDVVVAGQKAYVADGDAGGFTKS